MPQGDSIPVPGTSSDKQAEGTSSDKQKEKDVDSSQLKTKTTDQSQPLSNQKRSKDPSSNANSGKDKQSTSKTNKSRKKNQGAVSGVGTEFDLYPVETSEQAPWEEGPAGAHSKRLRSPTDALNQSPTKHPTGVGREAPASPLMGELSVSELEHKWAAWTKEGLLALCKSHSITLLVTNKLAVIKVIISQRVTFVPPPKEFQAAEIRSTSPVAGSTK